MTPDDQPADDVTRLDHAALMTVIEGRRSVRAFTPEPAPRQVVLDAIAAAGWAPSPHGRQPWRFVVVESAARRRLLADAMADTWRQQLQLDGQPDAIVAARLAKSRQRLIVAPIAIIACLYPGVIDAYPDSERQQAERLMAIQSLGAAVQNLLLSIYADGLDAGWMCAPLFCPDIVRAVCGIGNELEPHALIPVGHAARDPLRRPRLPVDDLIAGWL